MENYDRSWPRLLCWLKVRNETRQSSLYKPGDWCYNDRMFDLPPEVTVVMDDPRVSRVTRNKSTRDGRTLVDVYITTYRSNLGGPRHTYFFECLPGTKIVIPAWGSPTILTSNEVRYQWNLWGPVKLPEPVEPAMLDLPALTQPERREDPIDKMNRLLAKKKGSRQ